jgi:uncharacterized membrane protein YfhO
MPIAYLVKPMIDTLNFDELGGAQLNTFANQNLVLTDMLGLDEIANFIAVYPEEALTLETENVTKGFAVGNYISYKVEQKGKNAQLKYTFTAAQDGEQYMWIPSEYERKLNVWVNGAWKGNFFEVSNYNVKDLGDFKKGDKITVILTLTKDDLYIKERVYFGYIDEKLYKAAIDGLHKMNENTVVNRVAPAHLVINTDRNEEDILFTTIPIEPGWKIKIDGVPVNTDALFANSTPDIIDKLTGKAKAWAAAKITLDNNIKSDTVPVNSVEPIFDALIGIRLSAGSHTVDMQFIPNYYPFAWILSLSGLVVLIGLSILQTVYNRKHKLAEFAETETEEITEPIIAEEVSEVTETEKIRKTEMIQYETTDSDHNELYTITEDELFSDEPVEEITEIKKEQK